MTQQNQQEEIESIFTINPVHDFDAMEVNEMRIPTIQLNKHNRRSSSGNINEITPNRKNTHSVEISKEYRILSESPVRSINPIKEDVKENNQSQERPYFLTVKPESPVFQD